MSVRSEVINVLQTRFNGIEFTSETLFSEMQNCHKTTIRKTISELKKDGLIHKVRNKKSNKNQNLNCYMYGRKPVDDLEPVTVDIKPKWAEYWPNVWAGLQRRI